MPGCDCCSPTTLKCKLSKRFMHDCAFSSCSELYSPDSLQIYAAGSKDLTQLVSHDKQGNHQSASHLIYSCSSTAEPQVRQHTAHAFAPRSPHREEHKETRPEGVLNSNGTTLQYSDGTTSVHSDRTTTLHSDGTTSVHSDGINPLHTGGTTTPHNDGTTPPHSDSTTPLQSDGTTQPRGDGTTPQHDDGSMPRHSVGTTSPNDDGTTTPHMDGTTPLPLPRASSSAVASAALSSSPASQVTDTQNRKASWPTVLRSSGAQAGSESNVCHGDSNGNPHIDSKSECGGKSELGSSWEPQLCRLPYVLFAIDGTWQEAKEIYKVCKQLAFLG